MNKLLTIAQKKEYVESDRAVVAWASKPVIDRSNEIIDAKAWDLGDFLKNRVLMLSHDYSKLPVGKVLWIKATPDGLKFKAQFADTTTGREVEQLYKEDVMNAFSVGFIPIEHKEEVFNEPDGSTKNIIRYTKCKLLEISCVSIPCCPDALVDNSIKSKDLSEAVLFCKSHIYNDNGDVIEIGVQDVNTDIDNADAVAVDSPELKNIDNPDETIQVDDIPIPFSYVEIEEKVGRVLSKKNRNLINATVVQMEEAVSALNDLLDMTNTQEDEITIEDIETKGDEIDIDEQEISMAETKNNETKDEEVIEFTVENKTISQPDQQEELIKNVVQAVAGLLSGNVVNSIVDKVVSEQIDIAIARMKGKVVYRH
jgi:HK97 family phage prohead protease